MGTNVDLASESTIRLHRGTAPVWALLAVAGGAAWIWTAGQAESMGSGPGTMGMAFPFFVGMWVVMMAAMMLPAIGPHAADELTVRGPALANRLTGAIAFGSGFLVPWAGYGLLAFAALLGTGRLADASPGFAKWLGVTIFAVAGLYQFTPAKRWALAHCRMVMAMHGGGPVTGGFSSGLRDGAICVGCCWALMTILFAVGVMNIWAMVGLAVVIFAEKILPRPAFVAALAGVVFLGLAVVAAFHPSILSGLHMTGMGVMPMDAGGM
jgi:predicted metal-binding membrane protein